MHADLLENLGRGADLGTSLLAAVTAFRGVGLAPARVSLSVITQQPGLSGLGWAWSEAGEGVSFLERPWGFLDSDEHRTSPVHEVITTGAALFLDAMSLASETRFPILETFRRAGATSYLALPIPTSRGDTHVLALWTKRPGGWRDADAAEVARAVPMLSLLTELAEGRRLLSLAGNVAESREKALVEASARAEARSRFLAVMSHEIRTPMHGVLGLGELLAHTALDERQRGYVNTLLGSSRSLLQLLNDILDFSKLEADRLELESIALDPVQLVEQVLDLLRPVAAERDLELSLRCDPSVPKRVLGDPARLRQVWVNLIGNAVKFTRRGSVTASWEVTTGPDGHPQLRGAVRDTGAGMTQSAQARVFEPFTQGDSSTTRRFGGTGLGLTISRALVERMGGTLGFETRIGHGSTFHFTIPLHPCTAPPETESQPSRFQALPGISALRVLVVDDNPVNRMLTERQLMVLGAPAPRLAADGREALEIFAADTQDLVLMDVQMPDVDGLEVTRRLRALPLPTQPYIVAMTANAMDGDRTACTEAGMDDFLAKPVSLDSLAGCLARALAGVAMAGKPHGPRPTSTDETGPEADTFGAPQSRVPSGPRPSGLTLRGGAGSS
jgi:signal transduction histidine kinase/ActR/RegA family two-component response regulator